MLIDLLRSRRSIRKFTDKPVEKEKVDILLETMLRAPSSRSLNPLEFVVVENSRTIEALSRSKPHGSTFMNGAALAIVVCADPGISDVWVEDASIASILLHLAAHDLGLGSCWVQIRKREHDSDTGAGQFIKTLLEISDEIEIEAIIAIGYPAEKKPGRGRDTLLFDRVSYEKYGQAKN